MDIKEIEILGDDINSHWYYTSKAKAVLRMLAKSKPGKVMDVGAGSGYFSKVLLEKTQADEAWCVDISYQQDQHTEAHQKPIHFVRSVDNLDADVVLLMDVLEHVDDDVALLTEYVSKVPSGSQFLISVPAFNWLWSPHDDFLEHRRRYTLKQLEQTVNQSGLKINKSCYYFSLVLPLAILTRLADRRSTKNKQPQSQLKKHGFITNTILKMLCSIDLMLFKHNRIAGLTVFCYARKE